MSAAVTDTKDRGRRAWPLQRILARLTPGIRRVVRKLPLRARLTLPKLALLMVVANAAAVFRIRRYARHSRALGLLRRVAAIVWMIFHRAMRWYHGDKYWW